MPRCPDLAIFVLTDDDDGPITLPLVHAHGIIRHKITASLVSLYEGWLRFSMAHCFSKPCFGQLL